MSRFVTPGHKPAVAGFALIVVLGFLVLLSVLVVAFFTSVTSESATTKQYSSGAATRQLADSVVQVAMGQIKAATTGANQTWASQPGMIRTYDTSGNPASNFKLYSSDAMVETGSLTLADVSDFDTAWSTKSAAWTDLNAPVTDIAGKANFPIIDGNNVKTLTVDAAGRAVPSYLSYDGIDNANGPNYSQTPPGVNPDGKPDIDGFAVDAGKVSYNTAQTPSTSNTPVPMPVRWLYQLRDGTFIAPDAGSTTTATFTSASAKPSNANPIVGRVAFWTDDETSKVNINTAGQGTYWDTPHFASNSPLYSAATAANASQFADYAYAAFQPASFEFQRYPGHPSQVALDTIFPGLNSATTANLTPRLVFGGSQGGTVASQTAAPINPAQAARKALYASVDEYLYADSSTAPRTSNHPLPTSPTSNTADPNKPLTKLQLEEAKFFITANSRAPEVNLFNQPRVCLWPIHKDLAANPTSPYTTAYDRLIAFCATLHNNPTGGTGNPFRFYFQRGDSQSSTNDYTGIADNPKLYAYLHGLMSKPFPGFGLKSFADKYGADSDQILTEIFDYIRCTNLSDPNLNPNASNPNVSTMASLGTWAKAPYVFANYQPTSTGDVYCGQVMPIKINSTMGFGRYYTVKDVSMDFACVARGKAGTPTAPVNLLPTDPDYANQAIIRSSNDVSTQPALANTPLSPGEKRVQMAIYLNYFLPSPGQLKCGPDMLIRVSNLEQIQLTGATNIDGGSLFPAPPTASGWVAKVMPSTYSGYNPVDAALKMRFPFLQHRSPFYVRSAYASANSGRIIYPFVSRAFTMSDSGTLVLANSVTLKIELFQAKSAYDSNDSTLASTYKATGAPTYDAITSDSTNLIQTINVTFPAGTFPAPTLALNVPGNIYGIASSSPQQAWGFDGKIVSSATSGAEQGSALIAQAGSISSNNAVLYDTVRTVSVLNGDARQVAVTSSVTNTAPQPVLFGVTSDVATYNNPNVPGYHYFTDPYPPGGIVGYQRGKLVPSIGAVGWNNFCPPNTEVNYCKYGDWDGPGVRIGSGAFINKPDEGDNSDIGTGGSSGIPYYGFAETTVRNVSLYTPNRLMPSAGMLGSLPTGVLRNQPWQTLLFRPQAGHPNAPSPLTGPPYDVIPDHLLMDLFWMPVVEPYAISEPFSTAGKINMNYQIAPFTYITRATGMISLLKNEKMSARPVTADNAPAAGVNYRLDINPSENGGTLQQVAQKFASGNIFRSATQICDLDLVPVADSAGAKQTWSTNWAANFWAANANTGDNLRERPYANLYARLTTKSNTFTVHFRVQSLQKIPGTDVAQWVENRDKITSEYRGASVVERYVDPDDIALVDFALPANSTTTLDSFYKFRVVSTRKFAP